MRSKKNIMIEIIQKLEKISYQISQLYVSASTSGGSITNINGLSYEKLTALDSEFKVLSSEKFYKEIKFNLSDRTFKMTSHGKFSKLMKNHIDASVKIGHGCKNPDEAYIDDLNKNVFIIEKKFQTVGGSVCEKIQTAPFKLQNYRERISNYNIVYIYCLSDWFKENCDAELKYLKQNNIKVFFGSNENYKYEIVKFMVDYNV